MKRCSMSSAVRKTQITAAVRSRFTPSRAARSKRTDSDRMWTRTSRGAVAWETGLAID